MTSSVSFETIKPHLLPIITLLVVIATVPLAIMPWISQSLEDYEKLGVQKQLLATLTNKANELEQLDISSSRELLQNTVEPALPSEPDPASVLGTVEVIARQSDVAVVGVDYANMAAVNKKSSSSSDSSAANTQADPSVVVAPEVSATITLEGGYENIASFVRNAESALRVFSLVSLHMSKIDPTTDDVTASFKVSAPYLPYPQDLGPIESPLPKLDNAETKIIDRINDYKVAGYAPTSPSDISGRSNPF